MSSTPQHSPIEPDRDTPTVSSGTPPIEDAYQAEHAADLAMLEEDDPQVVDPVSRSLEGPANEAGGDGQAAGALSTTARGLSEGEGAGEMTAATSESVAASPAGFPEQTGDWEKELSAHRVAVELRRIESELRRLVEERDPKRKRKLNGTSRWHELEEDIVNWRFSGRFDEDTLRRAQEMIARRHYLFGHLRFLASTRPTWNS